MPDDFRVGLPERAAEPGVVFGSKAVGEPPLMLALSVREAIRDAIASYDHRYRRTGFAVYSGTHLLRRAEGAADRAGPAVIPAGAAHS